jgi:hypothetical protein
MRLLSGTHVGPVLDADVMTCPDGQLPLAAALRLVSTSPLVEAPVPPLAMGNTPVMFVLTDRLSGGVSGTSITIWYVCTDGPEI